MSPADPPASEARIHHVARVDARLGDHDWRWAREHRETIEAHWAERVARQPRLFNGSVLLAHDHRLETDTLRVALFEADYASFLAYLDLEPPDNVAANVFALGALRSADGAFVLGVMGSHTANAGQAYFPAGTPDLSDVTDDGRVDLLASLERELREETGLDRSAYVLGEGWTVVEVGTKLALFRPVRLFADAASVERAILDHLASERDPELAGVRMVRGPDDLDREVMPSYLLAFLEDALRRL